MRRLLLAVALASVLTGCLKISAAYVPDLLLEGPGGNGWEKNQAASQDEPSSAQAGLVKTQTLVYEDRTSDRGYPGSLSVTTLRTLLRPSEESLREQVQERVRDEAVKKGLQVEKTPATGERTLKNGARSLWFVYNGTAATSGFFSRDADVKILGEIWQCAEEKTVVVAVGLAQVSDVRSVGGVPLPSDPDPTTWREIVADPRGGIEGIRGSQGLVYNVAC